MERESSNASINELIWLR